MFRIHLFLFLLVLTMLSACTGRQERAQMQQRLGTLNAVNRADTVLTATHRDEAQQLCHYFDRHGTPNEQMLAHYLLGRCYADMHEAPMALHCYQDAIDRADTTAQDCDFAQLSRVYGQSASIFYEQGLYRNDLEYSDLSVKYGYLGKDTLTALLSYANKAHAYEKIGLLDSAILQFGNGIQALRAHHYNNYAAGFCGGLAKKMLDNGSRDWDKLDFLFTEYEHHSGFFDAFGNINVGREVYYYCKGLYYLQVGKQDSAEYYFRKELRDGKDFNNQEIGAHGLAMLYQQKQKPDSVAKYALYSYVMLDSFFNEKVPTDIAKAKAMYDYSRQQELVQQEQKKTEEKQHIIWYLIIGVGILVFFIAYVFHRYYRNIKRYENLIDDHLTLQAEVMQLREYQKRYAQMLAEKEDKADALSSIKSEIESLKSEKSRLDLLLKEKESKIDQQKADIRRYKRLARQEKTNVQKQLEDSPIYKLLSEKAIKGQVLTSKEWVQLERFIVERLPDFYQFVSSREHALTTNMYHVCILVRLQIPFVSIANVMGVKAPTTTKICTVVLKKLFGKEGSGKDLEQELIQFN